ncbi:probable inactive receptor kinase At2g26730 [Actinidia eriantha]|uniref:probable inactive receptor kinase At2g26730 n=1 Tax=Actinidia eriantha TaxID=165200 RepID=UPI002582EEBB|nr:probable inactive receptor kinase At2g26730 [Actinidia eriantha]
MMDRVSIHLVFVTFFLLFLTASSDDEEAKQALVRFMGKLTPANVERALNFGWNVTSDPCRDKWQGVSCDSQLNSVRKIVLDRINLTGDFDAAALCTASSLLVLSLNDNNIGGEITREILNCQYLTHLYLSGNRFWGSLLDNFSRLSNLKRLDLADNNLSGQLPDLSRVSGLLSFHAQDNQFSGEIPEIDFSNLLAFNVSNNNLNGVIPDVKGRFGENSFSGNPELCGKPLPKACPTPPPAEKESKSSSKNRFLIYSGYGLLGLVVVLFVAFKLIKKRRPKTEKSNNVIDANNSTNKASKNSSDFKTGVGNRSEYSITSIESGMVSSSLVVLSSPMVNGLKFEDLLRAPAELVGKGKHGSLYKVELGGGVTLAVKRIKDWEIGKEDFKKRMMRIDQVKHPNVLPAMAYYWSKQERLPVYEFQQNGSLFRLLHGSQNGQVFGWESRVSIAASIAQALAFMHDELRGDGIAHGNLKSSNILLNKDMLPCISEYGLMAVDESRPTNPFKADVYRFGVILLELLTGKVVQNSGFNLASWVDSVVREEWTVEVFDKALISEGASEERMVNLLQVALKCVNPSPEARPSTSQVATIMNSIKEEEEERSISSAL